jgi:hypothetical protein
MILKKYYCPHCNEFKNRFQLKSKMIGIETYWFDCKWCHKSVRYTSDVILEILDKNIISE